MSTTETTMVPPAPAPAGTVPYHWILTLQFIRDGLLTAQTVSGSANLALGFSRASAFCGAQDEGRRMVGIPAGESVVILFFSLEREDL